MLNLWILLIQPRLDMCSYVCLCVYTCVCVCVCVCVCARACTHTRVSILYAYKSNLHVICNCVCTIPYNTTHETTTSKILNDPCINPIHTIYIVQPKQTHYVYLTNHLNMAIQQTKGRPISTTPCMNILTSTHTYFMNTSL